jgi:hypothetical protein
MDDETRKRFERLEALNETFRENMIELQAMQKNTEVQLQRFIDESGKMHETHEKGIKELDERLNILINTVERYITRGDK